MHYRSIQALRAVAALAVMLHHLTNGRLLAGAAGVDIFFVISGFIMGSIDSNVSPKEFLIKRLIRIVPLYWLVTLVMCLLAVCGVFSRFTFDARSLMGSLLFIPYAGQTGNTWPLVVPGWTLNLEILFYVIFAVGLWFGSSKIFAAIGLVALVLAGAVVDPGNIQLRFWTMPILLEFIGGLALAGFVRPSGRNLGLALLATGGVIFLLVELFWRYNEALRPLAWGGPAFLIVCGVLAIERAGAWPKRALIPLERIGDASYSLYLTHGFVVAAIHRKLGMSLAVTLVTVPLCLVVAFATFYGFEKPAGRVLNRLLRARRTRDVEPLSTPSR